ncbi:MAG: peptide chain release factor N(5)-glutamine methyltransferase [Geodermatophilaceae bacterium]|nr:peptide chain release factor N(5)-glutamine methyltransferase [Geodermatophilaceae bacterium]
MTSVREATERLAAAGVASPRYDAEALLAHVRGAARGALTDEHASRYTELVELRAARVPLQHLTGTTGFRYLELAVGPGVFVPRPETELLAGWAIDGLRAHPAPLVADLCAGSGAIALSLAHELPGATVYAVEIDPHAVAWAQRNAAARRAAGDRPITLIQADAADPAVLADLDGTVDAVLTNPPYVPDQAVVAPEVAQHDPPVAIFGGPDGLVVVRRLIARAANLLRPGGLLGVEHADLQGDLLPEAVAADGRFAAIEDHRDLNGRPRFTTAVRA